MEIRVNKNGKESYREKIYFNGRSITKCFTRKSDAAAWKRRMITERDQGIALGIAPRKDILFETLLKAWNEKRRPLWTMSTWVRYEGLQRMYLLPAFQGKMVREITAEVIDKHTNSLRQKETTAATIDRVVEILKAVLEYGMKQGYLTVNPAMGYEKTHRKITVEKYWTAEEAQKFLNANKDDPYYHLYYIAIATGMRRGELGGLLWSSVDFATNTIRVHRIRDRFGSHETTKTGTKRNIPMNSEVRHLLSEMYKTRKSTHVFTRPDGTLFDIQHLARPFKKAIERAGVKEIHWHCTRHSFASIFLMAHGNLHAGAKIMGHTNTEMTDRYGHISANHAAHEMEKMCLVVGLEKVV